MDLYLLASTTLTLLVILDPPGLMPVFLGLTRKMPHAERNRSALDACASAFAVIALFAFFGRYALDYLRVSIPALQAAGGLLLLLIALELLQGKGGDVSAEGTNVAIVPLGIPLLAGPGAIVAIMLAMERADGRLLNVVAVTLALVVAMVLVYLFLRFANVIVRVLRTAGVTLASRVAGMLLAAISVQMMADGVLALIRGAGLA